jgi:alpha-N-arabinofuranosidase
MQDRKEYFYNVVDKTRTRNEDVFMAAAEPFAPTAPSQAGPAAAKITMDPAFVVGPVRRRTFGAFVEHLGRCVYTGIFEPEHRTADEDGFRGDVLELTRELGVSTVRYPGGNFVSPRTSGRSVLISHGTPPTPTWWGWTSSPNGRPKPASKP